MRPLRQPDTGDRAFRLALIAIAGGVAIVLASRWIPSPRRAPDARAVPVATPTPPSAPIVFEPAPIVEAKPADVVAVVASVEPKHPSTRPAVARPSAPMPADAFAAPASPEPFVPLPLARAALDAVGADDDAEAVWLAAINDPAMPARDRSDLIEDLNENGFADPDDVQPEELPLVLARIDLIERVGPDAMDETNAAAFAEAYKDLVTIARRLMP